jgi:hypothetical protein
LNRDPFPLAAQAVHDPSVADDEIGKLHDAYFDDVSWKVLFLVVDTRPWLLGRFVLLAPTALGPPDTASHVLPTSLTRAQVESGPSLEAHKPVSRQHGLDVAKYWDWPFFAPGDPRFDLGEALNPPASNPKPRKEDAREDPHLRAASDTAGFHVQTSDGPCGHIDDWLVAVDTWTVREVVIDPKSWWPGEKVRISCNALESIDWETKSVHIAMSKDMVEQNPRYLPP